MKRTVTARFGRVSACLALVGMLWLASCQSEQDVKPTSAIKADSAAVLMTADPPVKPSGPGGGPY